MKRPTLTNLFEILGALCIVFVLSLAIPRPANATETHTPPPTSTSSASATGGTSNANASGAASASQQFTSHSGGDRMYALPAPASAPALPPGLCPKNDSESWNIWGIGYNYGRVRTDMECLREYFALMRELAQVMPAPAAQPLSAAPVVNYVYHAPPAPAPIVSEPPKPKAAPKPAPKPAAKQPVCADGTAPMCTPKR